MSENLPSAKGLIIHFSLSHTITPLLTMSFLSEFPNQVINLHPALPDTFPGIHAIERAYQAFQENKIKEKVRSRGKYSTRLDQIQKKRLKDEHPEKN